ncbi:AAEL003796-PA [Aedes aegypti]|uniref:AAEL003796-PA n=1 Tax=Aedes aegypti TaxID=7159 RepID=Q17EI3_AEDAE|nr:AAEL003796-PA [Aedes aegypti]
MVFLLGLYIQLFLFFFSKTSRPQTAVWTALKLKFLLSGSVINISEHILSAGRGIEWIIIAHLDAHQGNGYSKNLMDGLAIER